ncbi:hypothetical protein Meth11DRAFT_0542 [Methylophilaceae bacterium 11]|nr:hypothetical protein Meth11DRAFT_0542 [Methylophilaceae bacterium 11]
MAAVNNVSVGGRSISLYRFTGEVIDSQRSSETSITSHSNGQVSSYTSHYNEIFLRDKEGKEISVEVASAGVPVRPGNTVTVLWGILGNKDKGPYTTVYNHDTGNIGHIAKSVNDLCGPHLYNMLIIVFVIVGVIGAFSLLGGSIGSSIIPLAATAGFFYWLTGRRRVLRAAMEDAAKKA